LSTLVPGYKLGRQIATGAGSRIYHATRLADGRPFALKRVERNSADDDRFLAQLDTEYEVTSKLDHPALRKSYLLHRVRKLLAVKEAFLVMDYIDGLPLEKARPNRLATFLGVARLVAAGLHALHEGGYVHSDIKPNNIMIAKGLTVKIIDFGQSCPMGATKERIQGTPDYIAPEQVRRRPLDRRTDVFNLGATMYWLLTSRNFPTLLAEPGGRGAALVDSSPPVAPIDLNDKIPRPLSNLVMECCRENPAERPADMRRLGDRLEVIQKTWLKELESSRARLQLTDGAEARSHGTRAEDYS
jgi:serine/threonine-protein kinase